jgi:hypothetical protein
MSELWMDSDKGKELLSDIDPEGLDEACSMVYNLHEDALCLKSERVAWRKFTEQAEGTMDKADKRIAGLEQERDQLKQQLVKATSVKDIKRADCAYCGGNESWAEHDAKVIEGFIIGLESKYSQYTRFNTGDLESEAKEYAQALRDKE